MDGANVEVRVSEGDLSARASCCWKLEAMKMEHPLKAGMSGVKLNQAYCRRSGQEPSDFAEIE